MDLRFQLMLGRRRVENALPIIEVDFRNSDVELCMWPPLLGTLFCQAPVIIFIREILLVDFRR